MKTRSGIVRIGLFVVLCTGVFLTSMGQVPSFISPLPDEIMRGLRKEFPGGKVTGFSRERRLGIWVFEVRVRKGRERYEVEITRDGGLLEISHSIAPAAVPPQLMVLARARLKFTRVVSVQRMERRGTIRDGVYKAFDKPRIRYEISYVGADGRRHERQLDSNGVLELPATVLAALNRRFQGARIVESEIEVEGAEDRFDVELETPAKTRVQVVLDRAGNILEMEYPVSMKVLPAAAVTRLQKDRDVRSAKKVEVRRRDVAVKSSGKKGRSRKRRKPVSASKVTATFIVTVFSRHERMRVFRFARTGKLISASEWERVPESHEGDDKD